MCTLKTKKHRFPFYIISTIVPNDTRFHVIFLIKVSRTISFNCCTFMFQQYCTRMNKEKEQVTIFDSITLTPLTERVAVKRGTENSGNSGKSGKSGNGGKSGKTRK